MNSISVSVNPVTSENGRKHMFYIYLISFIPFYQGVDLPLKFLFTTSIDRTVIDRFVKNILYKLQMLVNLRPLPHYETFIQITTLGETPALR